MPEMLTCPLGHSWGPAPDSRPDADRLTDRCPICGGPPGSHAHAAPPTAPPGFEVLGEIGRGGTGVVYKARLLTTNRVVAIKMLLAGSHAAAVDVARLHAESEALAHLDHPNIVKPFEVGT